MCFPAKSFMGSNVAERAHKAPTSVLNCSVCFDSPLPQPLAPLGEGSLEQPIWFLRPDNGLTGVALTAHMVAYRGAAGIGEMGVRSQFRTRVLPQRVVSNEIGL